MFPLAALSVSALSLNQPDVKTDSRSTKQTRPLDKYFRLFFTQICVSTNDHLSFSLVRLFEVQSSHSFLFELGLLLVEQFTPDRHRNRNIYE